MPDANRNAIEHVQHNQIIGASYEGRVLCDKWESIKEYIRLNNHIPRDEYNRYIRPLSYCGYVGYTQFICVPDSLATEIVYIKANYYMALRRAIRGVMCSYYSIKLVPQSDIRSTMIEERNHQRELFGIDCDIIIPVL